MRHSNLSREGEGQGNIYLFKTFPVLSKDGLERFLLYTPKIYTYFKIDKMYILTKNKKFLYKTFLWLHVFTLCVRSPYLPIPSRTYKSFPSYTWKEIGKVNVLTRRVDTRSQRHRTSSPRDPFYTNGTNLVIRWMMTG